MSQATYTLAKIATLIGAQLHGDADCVITGIASLDQAKSGQLTFLDNVRYRKYLPTTQASAVILSSDNLSDCPTNSLVMANPYHGYATVAHLFWQLPTVATGIHPTAVIGKNCQIHPSASIGPYCVLGAGVVIEEKVVLHSGCSIGDNSHIGAGSCLWSNVNVYYGVTIGKAAIIHSGAVIGSDGFGFANDRGNWLKVPQLGGVRIGNNVEIGACTTIDRGAVNDTVIEDDVKLDNQIQIGHNVRIGAHTAIAGCVAIAGSTSIGKYCLIGGGVRIVGHAEICDKVSLTATSAVAHSITEPGVYSGAPAQPTKIWARNLIRMGQLDDMARKLHQLEKIVKSRVD